MAEKSYQLVLAGIEDDLAGGRLRVGQKLPGERTLAERYAVSRSSVREAVRILEALGVVRTAVGSGPDAGAIITAEPAAPIGAAMRWHLASHHLPVSDIVGARVLIESWAAARAAEAGNGPAILAAQGLLDTMDDPALTATEFLAHDARFHVALADSAGNAVVAAIMAAMRTGIESYVTAALSSIDDWPAMADRLRIEHRDVLQAIVAGDSALASSRVCEHIEGFYASAGLGTHQAAPVPVQAMSSVGSPPSLPDGSGR